MEKRRDGQLTLLLFIFHFPYSICHLSSPQPGFCNVKWQMEYGKWKMESLFSERPHAIFKLLSDARGVGSALKSYRLAESHSHRSWARKVSPLAGQVEQPFDLDRSDRQVEICGQQTDPVHKRIHSPVCGRAAFGKDERAVA